MPASDSLSTPAPSLSAAEDSPKASRCRLFAMLLALAVFALGTAAIYLQPKYNWDMMAYIGLMHESAGAANAVEIHERTYGAVREAVSKKDFDFLITSHEGYRQNTYADPESFAQQLDWYAIRVAYWGLAQFLTELGLHETADGRLELKMDPALRGMGADESPEDAEARSQASAEAQWKALERITCPTLVVRGAASDILSPDTADRMVDDVLANGRLAIVPQAGHSVMTDNPEGFLEVLSSFLLEEE